MKNERGLFDEEFRLEQISHQKDPLIMLNQFIDWESFRSTLEKALKKDKKGPGGRPAYDYVMMFKILILQHLYNLSDAQMQYQILDRLSFMRFLGLNLCDSVPDEKTIWLFRERLTQSGTITKLFEKFKRFLLKNGVIANTGNIVDASFIEVPKQRNSKEENDQIKDGNEPENWSTNKTRQKDTDARWTIKNKQRHYGYKNHIKVCKKSKLIKTYTISSASTHDSQCIKDLLEESDSRHDMFADSAYAGKPIKTLLQKNNIRSRIHEKGYRNNPLTKKQRERNRKRSKIRCRVEHVFGFMKNSMNGSMIRSIGITRAKAKIGLMNLCYNMNRFIQLQTCYAK